MSRDPVLMISRSHSDLRREVDQREAEEEGAGPRHRRPARVRRWLNVIQMCRKQAVDGVLGINDVEYAF